MGLTPSHGISLYFICLLRRHCFIQSRILSTHCFLSRTEAQPNYAGFRDEGTKSFFIGVRKD